MNTKYPATITGMETEGPLAGTIVCPMVNLWNITKVGKRRNIAHKVKHGFPIFILQEREGFAGETLLLVRSRKYMRIKGWVTDRFVVRDGEDSDVGAQGV